MRLRAQFLGVYNATQNSNSKRD